MGSKKNIAVPGQCLKKLDEETRAGDGTHVTRGYIFASVVGEITVKSVTDPTSQSKEWMEVSVKPTHIDVKRAPSINSIVTCKITNIGPMHCKCSIHCIEDHVLRHPLSGMIRKEDIRDIEKGTVEIWKCFRPGDIVLARVIGTGESGNFLLSTAEDHLGVAVAYSATNKETPMIPVNWTQMRCPKSYVKELRKVAKINFGDTKSGKAGHSKDESVEGK